MDPVQQPGKMARMWDGAKSMGKAAAPTVVGAIAGHTVAMVETGSFAVTVGSAALAAPLVIQCLVCQILNKIIDKVCRGIDPVRICEFKAAKDAVIAVAITIILIISGVICPPLIAGVLIVGAVGTYYHMREAQLLEDRREFDEAQRKDGAEVSFVNQNAPHGGRHQPVPHGGPVNAPLRQAQNAPVVDSNDAGRRSRGRRSERSEDARAVELSPPPRRLPAQPHRGYQPVNARSQNAPVDDFDARRSRRRRQEEQPPEVESRRREPQGAKRGDDDVVSPPPRRRDPTPQPEEPRYRHVDPNNLNGRRVEG